MPPFKNMKNIVLYGFMGTGKTTVGFRLARELSMTFIDLDSLIEFEAGRSVREIFADCGEEAFRALEREAVRSVVSGKKGDGIVLATGGGTAVDDKNRALLKEWGFIICLRASLDTILERTEHGGGVDGEKRPLLDTSDRESRIKALLEERAAAYGDCDLSLDTTRFDVGEVVAKIRAFVEGKVVCEGCD